MLSVKGDDVMRILNIPAGPRVGQILAVLLEEVLDDPSKNKTEYLESRVKILGVLPDAELRKLGEKAREKKEEFESGIEEEMKRKHHVE